MRIFIVELPLEEQHLTEIKYACASCTIHALSLVNGGTSYPANTRDFSCEFHYEGIEEQMMTRESDRNRQMFHKGHYEVIAARFREQISRYVDSEGIPVDTYAQEQYDAVVALANALADRFEFDNEKFDRAIFLERCGI